MRGSRQRAILLAFALLWLVLRVPQLGARFSFDWDSSQYARGMAEFNVVKHQPHPPGYLLYVLAARAATKLGLGPMHAQVLVAFGLTLIGLPVFFLLARKLAGTDTASIATVILAFSPAVALYSATSSPDIADLVSSSIAGYLAFLDPKVRQWRIVACLAALGVLGGFRQSGISFLAPLIIVALIAHWRDAWRAVSLGIVLGAAAFLAWYIPLTRSVGGWRVLSGLVSTEFHDAAIKTSIFFGGSLHRHVGMIEENIIYFGMNLVAWLIVFGLPKRLPANWWRYALWLLPNLIVVFAIHGAKVGYCLLSFPPLLLLIARSQPRMVRAVAGVLASLAISYFPYGRLLSIENWLPDYIVYKSTPRLALDLESSQRRLDPILRSLNRDGVCQRGLPEAPNIRTVTYDFSFMNWSTPQETTKPGAVWLFNQHGPDANLRSLHKGWQEIYRDDLNSLWLPVVR